MTASRLPALKCCSKTCGQSSGLCGNIVDIVGEEVLDQVSSNGSVFLQLELRSSFRATNCRRAFFGTSFSGPVTRARLSLSFRTQRRSILGDRLILWPLLRRQFSKSVRANQANTFRK